MENNTNHCNDSDDEILDWTKEAEGIIRDIHDHVKEIFISTSLNSNNTEIFLNLKTLENNKFCIKVSGFGFQIAGKNYDNTDELIDEREQSNAEESYETPYALLTEISPGYVQSFANRLQEELMAIRF